LAFKIQCSHIEHHISCIIAPVSYGFDRPIGYFWTLVESNIEPAAIRSLEYLVNFLALTVRSVKADFALTQLSKAAWIAETTTVETAKNIANSSRKALACSAVVVWKLNHQKRRLETIAFAGGPGKILQVDMMVKIGQGVAGKCVLDDKCIVIDDLLDKTELNNKGIDSVQHPGIVKDQGWRSAVFVPLDIGGQVAGVLAAYGTRTRGFSELDKTIAIAFAQRLCAGYVHAQRIEQLSEMERRISKEAPAIEAGILAMEGIHDADDQLFQARAQIDDIVERYKDEKNHPIYKAANQARHNIDRAKRLMTELRKRSRIRKLNLSRIDLKVLLNEAKDRSEFDANRIKAKISVKCPDETIFIADKEKLIRVILNLINNSIYFLETDRKGGEKTINISVEVRNNLIIIHFKDNGPGIAPYDINKVFDYFFTTKGERGMGFGLAIAKNIIELHNGTIEVISKWGSETEFLITLPYPPKH
jgi:signal transduction histidine kinase